MTKNIDFLDCDPSDINLSSMSLSSSNNAATNQRGNTLTPTTMTVTAQGAGLQALLDGHEASITINDQTFTFGLFSRGINMIVVDTAAANMQKAVAISTFDTHGSECLSGSLAETIAMIPETAVVAIVVVDEASMSLTKRGRAAMASIGARLFPRCGWRDGYALITPVRSPYLAVEAHKPDAEGGLTDQVSLTFEFGAPNVPSALPAESTGELRLIKARSAGRNAGSFAEVVVDGVTERFTEQGLQVVIVLKDRKMPLFKALFQTHVDEKESELLFWFLADQQAKWRRKKDTPAAIVCVAVGDMARRMQPKATTVLQKLGSQLVSHVENGVGFAMIAKLHARESIVEAQAPSDRRHTPTRWINLEL
ncbi:hypothetical protein AMAG_17015 [Allomyces macrogynus ATCC 38327]|uniref:ILEI/PANDER domain-containing protein n=1 Tax=Allomyces macrogynus (strain ATCC 38327) TaxID=578462 RepID=A0A0L0TCK0_ALLM3|nr:hypothetical protein AMAG_17015 [Allomyces macrogynus ATCC 38327]|eukprot:KNE72573.1 hypothetical protein AMAG_17015 [Allomyces macrogynus ATCC 38327]